MSEQAPNLPEPLRQAVAADMRPVKPLPPPGRRVLWALPLALILTVWTLLYFGIRDLEPMGPYLAWVPLGLQVVLGLALLLMALREAVPGMRIPRSVVFATGMAALVLHIAVNILIWLRYPMGYDDFLSTWWACFHYEFLLGVPFLIVVTCLAARALPLRPQVIGLLSGVGGGVIADASWRLVCPVSVPLHFLTAHLGGIVLLGAFGYLAGSIFERSRQRLDAA